MSKRQLVLTQPFLDYVKDGTLIECCNIHPGMTCLQSFLKKFLKVIPGNAKVMALIHIFPVLIFKPKTLTQKNTLKKVFKGFMCSLLFATFMSTGCFGAYCFFKHLLGHESRLVGLLAGFVGCLSCWFEPMPRRVENIYFFAPKVMETFQGMLI